MHYYPDGCYMPITVYQGDFNTLHARPLSKYSMSWFNNPICNIQDDYIPYDKPASKNSKAWCNNTSCSIPVDSDSSSTYNYSDRDLYSPGKSNVRDSSSTAMWRYIIQLLGKNHFVIIHLTLMWLLTVMWVMIFMVLIILYQLMFKLISDIGSGIAVGGGLIGGSVIAATSESSTIAKLGIMVAGGVIGGASSILFNAIHMISRKKLNKNRPEVVESMEELNTIVKAVQARASSTKAKPKSGESKYVDYVYNEPSIEKGPDIVTDLFL